MSGVDKRTVWALFRLDTNFMLRVSFICGYGDTGDIRIDSQPCHMGTRSPVRGILMITHRLSESTLHHPFFDQSCGSAGFRRIISRYYWDNRTISADEARNKLP